MEKHSYLMMLDNDHAVLNTLKQFMEMESSGEKNSGQSNELSALSENVSNLIVVDITLPVMNDKDNKNVINNCSGTPVIKISAKCEIASLGDALELIMEANSDNESLKALDSMALLMSRLKKEVPVKFSKN